MAAKKEPAKATKKATPKSAMKVAAPATPAPPAAKAKAAAPAATPSLVIPPVPPVAPAAPAKPAVSFDQIKARAYEVWLRKGCPSGQDVQNWEQAERELGVR